MKHLLTSAAALLFLSCCSRPAAPLLSDTRADGSVAELFNMLSMESGRGIMLGHQDDMSYGHARHEFGHSDVHELTGDWPAVVGWDLGHIEMGREYNIDSVRFDDIRRGIIEVDRRGGVSTLSWHARNVVTGGSAWDCGRRDAVSLILGEYREQYLSDVDKVADFLLSLKRDDGTPCPVVLRLLHEQTASWFWWGADLCTPEEYNELYRITVSRLRDVRGVHNVLYAISPSEVDSEEELLERYPGDSWVDVIGFDLYRFSTSDEGTEYYRSHVRKSLEVITGYAEKSGKIAVLSETGMEGISDPEYFTGVVYPLIKDFRIAWILFWRNAWEPDKPGHFYLPYNGHPAAADFLKFIGEERILMNSDLGKIGSVSSPDGRISVTVNSSAGHFPTYSIRHDGCLLVDNARLGLEFTGWTFGLGADAGEPEMSSGAEKYSLVTGKNSEVDERWNQMTVPFEQDGKEVDVVVKVFDCGVGLRYVFPKQKGWKSYVMTDELTTFEMAGNPDVLTMYLGSYTTSHEGLYRRSDYDGLLQGELMEMPVLFTFGNGSSMAVTEAAVRDYAGSYLCKSGSRLLDRLSPLPGQEKEKVKATLPHRTPWRAFMIGDCPGDLVSSNLLTDLNDPCAIGDTSWVRPGKTTFSWWNGNVVPDTTFLPGNNFDTNKYYIDFCANHKIDFHSIYGYAEQPWYYDPAMDFANPDPEADVTRPLRTLDMERIGEYAAGKGVGLHLWVNWKPFYAKIDEALPLFERWNVKGMMVDFMDRDDQEMIRIQEEILRKSAEHHIFVQFHGSCKPNGLNRTYPNEFTREGTRNYECYKWSVDLGPDYDIPVPFTRLLAGATDYHLGGFRAVPPKGKTIRYVNPTVTGTRCHMLGMYVVLESYLGMVCDAPANYIGQPGFEFIMDVPTSWDKTVVPSSEVMEHICVARRKGNDWWVGAITDLTARNVPLHLDFLDEGAVYEAVSYSDAADTDVNPNILEKSVTEVRRGDIINLRLASGGGAAIHIHPLKENAQ